MVYIQCLRHLTHHLHYTLLSPIFQSFFSIFYLSIFLWHKVSSLVCIHLDYLRTDISGIEQTLLFHLIIILLSFILISFMSICILCVFVSVNKWSLISSIVRYYKSPPFYTKSYSAISYSSCAIWCMSFSSHFFYGAKILNVKCDHT